jgi:CysZ protein
LLTTPRAWPYALVPGAVLAGLSVAMCYGAVTLVSVSLDDLFGHPATWYGAAGTTILRFLGWILAIVIGLLLALLITPPLSSPALEHIVAQVEASMGIAPRGKIGFFAEIWCGLRAQAAALVITVPLLALLWLVEFFFAPAVWVTVPLKFVVSAFGLAWNLFDYPLTLRGVRIRRRLRIMLEHKAAAFGFGIAFAILFWLPGCGVLMLPVGVVAATRLTWKILEARPDLLGSSSAEVAVAANDPPALSSGR